MSTSFISSFISTNVGQQSSVATEVQITSADRAKFDKALDDQLDLGKSDIKDLYKELKYPTLKEAGFVFGDSLENLATNDGVYDGLYNGASGNHLLYAKKRTQILEDLIKVMHAAKADPKLLDHFLKRTEAASKAAGLGIEDSVHWQEIKGAITEAIKGDRESERLYASHDKAFIYDPTIFQATLAELEKRHAHISQIKEGPGRFGLKEAGQTMMLATVSKGAAKLMKAPPTWLLPKAGFWGSSTSPGLLRSGLQSLKTLPGWLKLIGVGLVAVGTINMVRTDVENGESWTKSFADLMPDSFMGGVKAVASVFIPDIPKFWGGSFFEDTNQLKLRNEVGV